MNELICALILIIGAAWCIAQLEMFGPEKKNEKDSDMDDPT